MAGWTAIGRTCCFFMLALLLSGCGVLASEKPLIATSAVPAEPFVGKYRAFNALDPRELRKVPAPYRAQCLDPGYSMPKKDRYDRPTGTRVHLRYCSYDVDERESTPPTRIARLADGFALDTQGKTLAFKLRGLRDGLYLAQFGPLNEEGSGFFYSLFRITSAEVEYYLLPCDDFPSVAHSAGLPPTDEASTPNPERRVRRAARAKSVGGSEQKRCDITDLGSIARDLDAVLARTQAGGGTPVFILRPLPD